jgi:phage tail-like protein
MKHFAEILKDALTTKAYAARTFSADPLMSFKFRVAISGIPSSLGFQKVGGLSREKEVVEYLEGMMDHAHKLPGRETVGEVTFERGMYPNDDNLINAYKAVFDSADASRSDVTINVCDRFGTIRKTFQLAECWFSGYEIADLDATSSDVLIETLTMQFESFL